MGPVAVTAFRTGYVFCAAAVLVVLVAGRASADSCETAPGSQVYTDQNCAKQENTYDLGKGGPKSKPAPKREESLRDKLKRAFARKAEHDRAAQAAFDACQSGDAKTFRANMKVAVRTGDDDQDTKSIYEKFARSCEAKFADAPPETTPEVAAVPPAAEPVDPLNGWPPACRTAAARLLAGGRKRDGAGATAAYAALHDDEACSPYLSSLAGRTGARLPERKMSDRSRRALQRAMSGDAAQLADSVGDREYDASYDANEVLNFGLALLGAYANVGGGGLRAASVSRIAPRVQASAPAPSFRPRPPPHQSDISGTTR